MISKRRQAKADRKRYEEMVAEVRKAERQKAARLAGAELIRKAEELARLKEAKATAKKIDAAVKALRKAQRAADKARKRLRK